MKIIVGTLMLYGLFAFSPFNGKGQPLQPWTGVSQDLSHGRIIISEDKRSLQFQDGTPFFWLGDTAWELFHRLDKTETEIYLENRRERGFTVIQAVVLPELNGLSVPNRYGQIPLLNNNPLEPNIKYFEYVDWVINRAKEKGIFIALLPVWGDKVDKQWGVGPVIFNEKNAFIYGQWIGNRYKGFSNIIWVNGGDRSGNGKNSDIWKAMAFGIKSEDKSHLMTFHPLGDSSSSEWFQDAPWLDFNMCQTGHCQRGYYSFKSLIVSDYNKLPVKPCLDGEACYEDHPVCWNPEVLGWFDDTDERQEAYWSLFSGAFGHTYGCNSIWQFYDGQFEPIGKVRHSWKEGINLPGAWEMLNLRRLFQSRPTKRVPYPELILNKSMSESDYLVATKGENYAFVYLPTGMTVTIDLRKLGWRKSCIWWFNPRNGKASKLNEMENSGILDFKPETFGRGNDYVLVFDNVESGFIMPGHI